jgi:hypothetical protein
MKFYFRGVIWDKDKDGVLCTAEDGLFETEDAYIIEKLTAMNIPTDGKVEPVNKGIVAVESKTGQPVETKKGKKK